LEDAQLAQLQIALFAIISHFNVQFVLLDFGFQELLACLVLPVVLLALQVFSVPHVSLDLDSIQLLYHVLLVLLSVKIVLIA